MVKHNYLVAFHNPQKRKSNGINSIALLALPAMSGIIKANTKKENTESNLNVIAFPIVTDSTFPHSRLNRVKLRSQFSNAT